MSRAFAYLSARQFHTLAQSLSDSQKVFKWNGLCFHRCASLCLQKVVDEILSTISSHLVHSPNRTAFTHTHTCFRATWVYSLLNLRSTMNEMADWIELCSKSVQMDGEIYLISTLCFIYYEISTDIRLGDRMFFDRCCNVLKCIH